MQTLHKSMNYLLAKHNTYVFCIVHNPGLWHTKSFRLNKILSPWLRRQRLEFITLSPHVAKFMQEKTLRRWKTVAKEGAKVLVRCFVPVFPVQLPPVSKDDESLSFGLQGHFEQSRRDYRRIFFRLKEFLSPHSGDGSTPEIVDTFSDPTYNAFSNKSSAETILSRDPREITVQYNGRYEYV